MRREDTAPPAALRAQGRQGHAVLEISTSLLHPQPASPRPRSKFHPSFGTPRPAAPSLCPSSEMPHHRALSSRMPAPPPPRVPPPGRPTDLGHLPDQGSSVQSGQEPAVPARAPRGTSLHTQGPKEPPVQTQGGSTHQPGSAGPQAARPELLLRSMLQRRLHRPDAAHLGRRPPASWAARSWGPRSASSSH